MNKSTVVLLLFAALGLGSLIGVSLVGNGEEAQPTAEATPVATFSTGGAPALRYLAPGDLNVEIDEFGRPLPLATGENFIGRDQAWKSQTLTIELPADGAIEYKALMEQGDVIAFHWQTSGGQAYYDFHAHDEAFGEDFFTRYDEGEGVERSGSIIAGYTGQHGWYWLNIAGEPLTITLEVAGFFDEIIKLDLAGY